MLRIFHPRREITPVLCHKKFRNSGSAMLFSIEHFLTYRFKSSVINKSFEDEICIWLTKFVSLLYMSLWQPLARCHWWLRFLPNGFTKQSPAKLLHLIVHVPKVTATKLINGMKTEDCSLVCGLKSDLTLSFFYYWLSCCLDI